MTTAGGLVLTTAIASSSSPEGALDLDFGSCGVSEYLVRDNRGDVQPTGAQSFAVQPDGRMLLSGNGTISRLQADGSPDVTFGSNGTTPGGTLSAPEATTGMVVQADGRIVIATSGVPFDAHQPYLARYLPNGDLDSTFGDGGRALRTDGVSIDFLTLLPDGKLIGYGAGLVRFLSSGAVDPSFATNLALPRAFRVAGVVPVSGGKLLVGVTLFGGDLGDFGVVRLSPDGSLDTTFGTNGLATVSVAQDVATGIGVDGSGRILIGGTIAKTAGMGLGVARLLPTGQLDLSYGQAGTVWTKQLQTDHAITGIDVQADGRVVMGADIEVTFGSFGAGLVRFTASGALDPTFGNGGLSITPNPPYGTPQTQALSLARTPSGDWLVFGRAQGPVAIRFRGAPSNSATTTATCTKAGELTPASTSEAPALTSVDAVGTPTAYVFTNTGTASLRVAKTSVSDGGSGRYTVVYDHCTGAALAVGASCRFAVAVNGARPLVAASKAVVLVWSGAQPGSVASSIFASGPAVVRAWGWNGVGGVGAGPADVNPTPTVVGMHALAVAAGYYHTVALDGSGHVWTWGWNAVGQLGDGTTTDRFSPVQVPGLDGVVAIAAGGYHTLALRSDGTVWAWGLNNVGQLGDGTTVDRHVPVQVAALPGVTRIAAGAAHNVAVALDGTVRTWGWNVFGQLGDGTTVDRHLPVLAPGANEATDVAAGAFDSLVLSSAGGVLAWGLNHVGQLGDGTTVDRHLAIAVPGTGAVTAIAAGAYHNLALARGAVLAWGWNGVGQLGDGTVTDRHSPVAVPMGAPATAIGAGAFDSFAVADGPYGWGWNATGQLGTGGTVSTATPARQVSNPFARSMSGGAYHSVGLSVA